MGNIKNYIETYCEEGQIFHDAEILFGHMQTDDIKFGYFPQTQNRIGTSDIEKRGVRRDLDKQTAYYSEVEWLVISDSDSSATLLSKDLLFSVDYLNFKYPLKPCDKNMSERIKELFFKHIVYDENEKWKITNARFLSESELNILLARSQKDPKKKIENKCKILLPKATFFSQVSSRTNVSAFWLAGDMENARRVDTWKEGFSDIETGVETYYVRLVVDITKQV